MSDPEPRIELAHGGGGQRTLELVREVFARALSNPALDALDDGALLPDPGGRLAVSTDGFVVRPRAFPGGDIGALAIHGTVNDLAVSGAIPRYLTLGAILEEGLPLAELRAVVASAAAAARACGVEVVAGDTKVVERGHGDGIYLTTTGIGVLRDGFPPAAWPGPGDVLLVSGPVGDHGAVILAARMELDVGTLRSDCAPVTGLVGALVEAGVAPTFLRDPTRGGLGVALCDLAEDAGPAGAPLAVEVEEDSIPVREQVAAVGEITGVDPLFLACEGRVLAAVPGAHAEAALAAWRARPDGADAAIVGRIGEDHRGRAVIHTRFGGRRTVLRPSGEQLPRIC